jgi:hypothetical protein
LQQQADAFAFRFSHTMLELLLEGALTKDPKTGVYNWEDKRKPQERADFEFKLHEARQALREDMMSMHLITKDQVLKAELDEMAAVREQQRKVREAPKEVITTDLGMSNMAKRLMVLGPMFTPAKLKEGMRRFLVSPDPAVKLYQSVTMLVKMKEQVLKGLREKEEKMTFR